MSSSIVERVKVLKGRQEFWELRFENRMEEDCP